MRLGVRANLLLDNLFGNPYDLGKELGANMFFPEFKQGQISFLLVGFL